MQMLEPHHQSMFQNTQAGQGFLLLTCILGGSEVLQEVSAWAALAKVEAVSYKRLLKS